MSDLRPCPFCGGNAPSVYTSGITGRVFCEDCGAEGPWSPFFDGGWNTRAGESTAAAPRFTFAQVYPGDRILLMLGQHKAGAVFPPVGAPPGRLPWVWRFWLATPGAACPEGRAKTEQAARNALLAQGAEWLRLAGVAG